MTQRTPGDSPVTMEQVREWYTDLTPPFSWDNIGETWRNYITSLAQRAYAAGRAASRQELREAFVKGVRWERAEPDYLPAAAITAAHRLYPDPTPEPVGYWLGGLTLLRYADGDIVARQDPTAGFSPRKLTPEERAALKALAAELP